MKTVQIASNSNYHRDVGTHAIININTSEYDAYMRQKLIFEESLQKSATDSLVIQTMQNDIETLKKLVMQLTNKDANGTSITNQ